MSKAAHLLKYFLVNMLKEKQQSGDPGGKNYYKINKNEKDNINKSADAISFNRANFEEKYLEKIKIPSSKIKLNSIF